MAVNVELLDPQTYQVFNKKSIILFSEDNNVDQLLITPEYAVSRHNGLCTTAGCRTHVLLYDPSRSQDQLLEDLSAHAFRYIMVDDFYSYYRWMIHSEYSSVNGRIMDNLKWAVDFAEKHPECIKQPSVLMKRVKRKKSKFHSKEGPDRRKSMATQTIEYSFNKRIESILDGPYAMEFARIIDCLYDRHGAVKTHKIDFNVLR